MNASYLAPRLETEATVQVSSDYPTVQSLLSGKKVFSTATANFNATLYRLSLFESASPLAQDLLLRIYDNRDNFVNLGPHPLDEYILSFDKNMESSSTVRAIGSAIGIYVDSDPAFFSYELFLDKLITCIQDLNIKYNKDFIPGIRYVIRMDRKTFANEVENKGFTYSENLYQDRLNFYRYISLDDEQRFAEQEEIPEAYDTTIDPFSQPQSSQILEEKYNFYGF